MHMRCLRGGGSAMTRRGAPYHREDCSLSHCNELLFLYANCSKPVAHCNSSRGAFGALWEIVDHARR